MDYENIVKFFGYLVENLKKHQEEYPNTGDLKYGVEFSNKGLWFKTEAINQFDRFYRLCTQLKFENFITDFKISADTQNLVVYLEW